MYMRMVQVGLLMLADCNLSLLHVLSLGGLAVDVPAGVLG